MKRALITGITGQDGAYLAQSLLQKGYEVWGGFRRSASSNLSRLEYLGIADQVKLIPLEMLEQTNVQRALETVQPDEVYNLAAQSYVGVSFEQPLFTAEVTAIGALRLLESIRVVNRKIKLYQASSSEMFGKALEIPQTEQTPFYPRSPYAVAKVFAHWATVNYRESYGLYACCGLLFNHESPLRGLEFVTRKISHGVATIKKGKRESLALGNVEARRDWGYAPEYVEAMWLMMQQAKPTDYVVATGETHSVRDFVESAFAHVGLDWKKYVRVDPALQRPAEVECLIGDASRARRELNWQPRTRFAELVRIMVDADLKRIP